VVIEPRVLDAAEWAQRLEDRIYRGESPGMFAFYSSVTQGITIRPELMQVPIDDHAIVRGHAVFDTATLAAGRLYRMSTHLDRLIDSAKAAKLPLPFGSNRQINVARMKAIIRSTCMAAGQRDAEVRYWLTAGPGNLGVTPEGCTSSFYVLIFGGLPSNPRWLSEGIAEVSVPCSEVPLKPRYLAELKSNNYMLNALTAMAARERGGTFGIGVDNKGLITEACTMNFAMVTRERVLKTPPFDSILKGTTTRKVMQLAESLVRQGVLSAVTQQPISLEEARSASEAFLLSGDTHLTSIVTLDGYRIGDGRVGPISKALRNLLEHDAAHGEDDHDDLFVS